jgi:hypothetical protein
MIHLKLSTLAIILGFVVTLLNAYGMFRPSAFAAVARRFPRNTPVGYVFMVVSTIWFVANLSTESIADFASFKPFLYALFIAVGLGACLFVKDFLPVRGLAVFLLLLSKLMVDTARWEDTQWRLVITTWAYVMVIAGMWFTISPWRLRDMILWATANEDRTRILSGLRTAFGLLVLCLGLTVFRVAEQKTVPSAAANRHEIRQEQKQGATTSIAVPAGRRVGVPAPIPRYSHTPSPSIC